MITAEEVNLIDGALKQLINCKSRDAAEKVFSDHNISDIRARIALLHRCMQVKNVYHFPSDNPLSDEELYDETLAFFEEGQWREFL